MQGKGYYTYGGSRLAINDTEMLRKLEQKFGQQILNNYLELALSDTAPDIKGANLQKITAPKVKENNILVMVP